jgi:hypothetical protein
MDAGNTVLNIKAVVSVADLACSPSITGENPAEGGLMPSSTIRSSTLASCRRAAAIASLTSKPVAWYSSATCLARRALVRLSASSRHTRRRAPMPGSISHQTPEAISIAERATTVGPITGIWSPSSR